ncbi:MAG: DUF5696 domain-containing protein [Ruminococcus flavefaciens]|nr:DUF5696 domain-containing protein [Ruminococcus flavefaciens]
MKRIKIFFLIIVIVFSMTVSGRIYTEDVNEVMDYIPPEFSHCTEVRTVAENENYRLLVYDETAVLGLQDKSSGYIWWSSPEDLNEETETPVNAEKLKSSAVLRYGEVEKRTDNNFLRSGSLACETGVSDIENGVRIDYNYKNAGFHFYIDYTLENDHMKASLKTSEIVEMNNSDIATEITILGSFGASGITEDGYFIIPDGCGALINFNNGKTQSDTYRQKIYGDDLTAVPERIYSVKEQVYLPMYAIVREDNAMLAVTEKGDSNAFISAEVSGQSGNYNTCSFTFVLRNTDTYYMSGNSTERLTVFENGGIDCGDIEICYYPICKKNISYIDVAERYRNCLVNNCNVKPLTSENYSPLYVSFYGGTEKKKSILGIPFMRKQLITSYNDAEKILDRLNADDIVVSYRNWTDNSIENKTDTTAKPSSVLGGKRDFWKLKNFIDENNYEFYPSACNTEYFSGNSFGIFSGTMRVSGVYSKISSYDLAYGMPDSFRKSRYLLSPECFGEVIHKLNSSYSGAGLDGFSAGSLTSSLYGDYGRNKVTRFRAMENITQSLSDTDISILADGANAYTLPYVNHIINVPLNSSRFDIFDEEIPFYQIVMHGLIPYTSTAVNGSPDTYDILLMSAVTGSNLYYDLISCETNLLKDTEFDTLYYANADRWIETVSEQYNKISPVLKAVSSETITDYIVEDSGSLITTKYSDGSIIKVDFTEKTINFNGKTINLR